MLLVIQTKLVYFSQSIFLLHLLLLQLLFLSFMIGATFRKFFSYMAWDYKVLVIFASQMFVKVLSFSFSFHRWLLWRVKKKFKIHPTFSTIIKNGRTWNEKRQSHKPWQSRSRGWDHSYSWWLHKLWKAIKQSQEPHNREYSLGPFVYWVPTFLSPPKTLPQTLGPHSILWNYTKPNYLFILSFLTLEK